MLKADNIGKIKDLVSHTDFHKNPFLYYLPKLLETKELKNSNLHNIITFIELTQKPESFPIVHSALKILNALIEPESGQFQKRSKDIFYNNNYFSWNELGDHTSPEDIINHILNRTIFYISSGKHS